MHKLNRRSFIKMSMLAGAGVLAGVGLANRESIESAILNGGRHRVSQSRAALGTHVDITAISHSQMQAEDAVAAAFDAVKRYESLFTRYNNQSHVCELNAEGRVDHIDPELAAILTKCAFYHHETRGAFDITVKPCIDLFKSCSDQGRHPTDSEIAEVMKFVGANRLHLEGNRLTIPEGMGITLDGVAPGFIADRVAELLQNHGITDYLVNAGGEIRTSGMPIHGESWRIAVQDPKHHGDYPGFIALNQGAVSTSGSYEIYYGQDRVFHHIVDAHTGKSPNTSVSVTVTAPTAIEADILSTALFVMNPEEAVAYADSHPGIGCLILDGQGNRIISRNFNLG